MSAPAPQGELEDLVVVGHPFAPIGMGEHLRSTVRALRAAGLKPGLLDVYGLDRGRDLDLERVYGPDVTRRLSRSVNLFCINANEVDEVCARLDEADFARAHNIIFPAWELPDYPQPWVEKLARFDGIWAPTGFVQDAIARATGRQVSRIPLAVDMKLSTFLGRRWFNIPEHAFVVMFAFDFSSYAARKNPFAVLDAFEQLVSRRPQAPLHALIKYKGGNPDSPERKALEARIARLNGRVQTITQEMSDNEVKNLFRNVDVFVSLHRAEGFGRGLAEAMALGTPVVATGWSGNMDFMDADTALLVDHRLVPVQAGEYLFPEGQHWAEPDVDQASRLIEQVMDRPAESRAMAERARRRIRVELNPKVVGLEAVEALRTR
ncbi:MAG: glycosyltransferase family 4 protein [Phenylobacterium sp.]|uniref:glycosyltransferase family 4 protein n=1 Tax=Phenylobacterium sp. TaxID=1871053 RepID=UPI0025DC0BC2|nr:glycosyltransferase family 4 protein [Phenylobacterium sp.]MCG9916317.1 glycosyltransferase family 4 protein [Phenylobacterium sp.]